MTDSTGPAGEGDRKLARLDDSGQIGDRTDRREQSAKPSPEELQRLVALHLGSGSGQRQLSPWLVRIISAVLAVLALVLLFTLLPEHCHGTLLP